MGLILPLTGFPTRWNPSLVTREKCLHYKDTPTKYKLLFGQNKTHFNSQPSTGFAIHFYKFEAWLQDFCHHFLQYELTIANSVTSSFHSWVFSFAILANLLPVRMQLSFRRGTSHLTYNISFDDLCSMTSPWIAILFFIYGSCWQL